MPNTKCYIFSVAIEDILYKKNCHVLNNGFKMDTLGHLNNRLLYASQINQYILDTQFSFVSSCLSKEMVDQELSP